MPEDRLTRRDSLVRVGGFLAVVLGAGGWKASLPDAAPACILTPETITGVNYVAHEPVRRNITEAKPGRALALRLFVVNAATCKPVRNAAVDLWQVDASGLYSHGSQTFLRGIQRTNGDGLAVFDTIYPGWYTGRTAHLHVKVHAGGTVVHTGHLYFPDPVTDVVYRRPPYNRHPGRDTRNPNDVYYLRNGGDKTLMRIGRTKSGVLVAAITMGIHLA